MDWGTLVATASGGLIAVSGTMLADRLRHRHEGDRGVEERRREVYVEFITAVGTCHARLRELAQTPPPEEPPGSPTGQEAAARAALTDSAVYEVRERLFLDASATVAAAGQEMFEHLRAVQRAVAAGAAPSDAAFHRAYHPYLDSVWRYRVAVREELEGHSLSPVAFGWREWGGRDRCPDCRAEEREGGRDRV
ncbi:CchlQ [Streptomyces sp. NA04227]|uniref:CchlQ n=1 Tax=Streptomyces sp. NA04227 TaxID=2742136 RepID=UPI001590F001|nr:CchlQ [Streptomyces sp. NA04227]QKW08443.1 CchlQ [Streptomyces sp. NA04227]